MHSLYEYFVIVDDLGFDPLLRAERLSYVASTLYVSHEDEIGPDGVTTFRQELLALSSTAARLALVTERVGYLNGQLRELIEAKAAKPKDAS